MIVSGSRAGKRGRLSAALKQAGRKSNLKLGEPLFSLSPQREERLGVRGASMGTPFP